MEPVFPSEAKRLGLAAQEMISQIRTYETNDQIATLYGGFVHDIVQGAAQDSVLVTLPCVMQLRDSGRLDWDACAAKLRRIRAIASAYVDRVGQNVSKVSDLRRCNLFALSEKSEPWAEYAVFDLQNRRATVVEHVDGAVAEKQPIDGAVHVYYHLLPVQELDLTGYLHSYAIHTLARAFDSIAAAFEFQLLWREREHRVESLHQQRKAVISGITGDLSAFYDFSFADLVHFRLEVLYQMQAVFFIYAPEPAAENTVGARLTQLVRLNEFILEYAYKAERQLLIFSLSAFFQAKTAIAEFDVRQVIAQLESRLALLMQRAYGQKLTALTKCVDELLADQRESHAQVEKLRECVALQQGQLSRMQARTAHFMAQTETWQREQQEMLRWCFERLSTSGNPPK